MSKEQLNQILENRDWLALEEQACKNKAIIRNLMSRIYIKDGLIFWRAVEALGEAASKIEKKEPGYAAELVRRYFWSLNEESGGTAWNASEAIGSIIYHNPEECSHFNWMFSALLEDESLQEGVLWGLSQLAITTPEVVYPLAEAVIPFLEAQEVKLRGLAVWIYALMKTFKPEKTEWDISWELQEKLVQDLSVLDVYVDGEFKTFRVSTLLNLNTITFWSTDLKQEDFIWTVTVATTLRGVCWVGLGSPEMEEAELRASVERWAPQTLILQREHPNLKVIAELKEYFAGNLRDFTIPLDRRGTPFQLRVWDELRGIPYGETRSYSDIARQIGNPKGQRAVGLANNKNPIGIIVPCHRVIGKKGALVGYASGIDHKERLLKLEFSSESPNF